MEKLKKNSIILIVVQLFLLSFSCVCYNHHEKVKSKCIMVKNHSYSINDSVLICGNVFNIGNKKNADSAMINIVPRNIYTFTDRVGNFCIKTPPGCYDIEITDIPGYFKKRIKFESNHNYQLIISLGYEVEKDYIK